MRICLGARAFCGGGAHPSEIPGLAGGGVLTGPGGVPFQGSRVSPAGDLLSPRAERNSPSGETQYKPQGRRTGRPGGVFHVKHSALVFLARRGENS